MTDIIERLAIIIYTYESGCEPSEYENIWGIPFEPWDKLEEWERDDYRFQAGKVVEYLTTGKIK